MRSEVLQDAVGMVRQDFVLDAHRPHRTAAWGAAAAALCLCAALGAFLLHRPAPQTPVDTLYPWTPSEFCIVPEWDDRTDTERYTGLEYEGRRYVSQGEHPIPQTQGLLPLGTAEADGWDWQTDETRKCAAEVFALEGVQTACAVGVRFAEGGAVYPYLAHDYRPETLGQMIGDLDLENNLFFGVTERYGFDAEGNWHRVQYEVEDARIWEMLLSDRGAENIADFDSMRFGKTDVDIAVNIPALGYENIALWTTEDGWLCTNILATGKAFFLGTEKTAAFRDYVLQNVPGTEVIADAAVTPVLE